MQCKHKYHKYPKLINYKTHIKPPCGPKCMLFYFFRFFFLLFAELKINLSQLNKYLTEWFTCLLFFYLTLLVRNIHLESSFEIWAFDLVVKVNARESSRVRSVLLRSGLKRKVAQVVRSPRNLHRGSITEQQAFNSASVRPSFTPAL